MPAIFTKGDIFQTEGIRAYAVGGNAAGAMDVGIAVAFRKRWPAMFDAYAAVCAAKGLEVGGVFSWRGGDETVFVLALTESETKKGKLTSLTSSLEKMLELASASGIEKIGLPRVGAGAAGLDWTRAKRILTELGEATPITLVVFEQFVRAKSTPPEGAP